MKAVADMPSNLVNLETVTAPSRDIPWRQRRDQLRTWLRQNAPDTISVDEIEVHCAAMPPHYWERVTEADLVWGLETIHGFLVHIASPNVSPTAPFVTWRRPTPPERTRVMLCTWDRHGLLAKAAAAFSAVSLNIVQAHVFTRGDNIVLDEFSVTNGDRQSGVSETRLQEMTFLLEGALSEPPRFASVWACSRHKYLAAPSSVAPRIDFDNGTSPDSTLVRIEATDRLGLLYDILQAIADAGLNIKQASIETQNNLARDTIHVADQRGEKVLDQCQLEALRARLNAAMTVSD